MRGGNWAIRERELQAIKQEHLLKRFQPMADIAYKHYRYSFQIIKHLALLPQPHHPLNRLTHTLQQVVSRKKLFIFRVLQRAATEKQDMQSKATILLAIFLERRLVGLWAEGLSKIGKIRKSSPTVSFDRQLFLMIKMSNLSKLLCFAKAEGFQAIKNNYSTRIHKQKTVILIRFGTILSNCINRQKVDAFLALTRPVAVRMHEYDDQDQDEQEIWVQSYKCMAQNIRNTQGSSRPLREMRKEAAVSELAAILALHQREVMRGCLGELQCFQNQRFTPSALAVLRREIAILEQEYESV